jgi:hypothetical protein
MVHKVLPPSLTAILTILYVSDTKSSMHGDDMPLQKLKTYIHFIWQWKLSGLKTDSDLQKSVHLREDRVLRSSVYLAISTSRCRYMDYVTVMLVS